MEPARAPLFSVSFAFALGVLLAFDRAVSLSASLVLFGLLGLFWLLLKPQPGWSLAIFYLFVMAGGLSYTGLYLQQIPGDDLRLLPEEKRETATQWRGVIVEEPTALISARSYRRPIDRSAFVLQIEAWRPTGGRLFVEPVEAPWQTAAGKVRCTLTGTTDLHCGDLLEFAAALEPVPGPLCPGELDLRDYEGRQGIFYHARIAGLNWRVTEQNRAPWASLSYAARDWAYQRLQIGLEDDPRTADFLAGMLIGYRQEIPRDIEEDFRRTGTLHVFAVSGQNVAELAVVDLILLQLCGLVRWRWAWLLAPVVLVYCLLTGSQGSAVRATIMALGVLFAWRCHRPLNALALWSLALLGMLVWDPHTLLDPGAQLSFGVVLALVLWSGPLAHWFNQPFHADAFLLQSRLSRAQQWEEQVWRGFTALLGASVAATAVSEPIAMLEFHQFTPVSVLANLIVVPIAGLITVVGTMAVSLSVISVGLASALNNANWFFARGLIALVWFFAHHPGAAVNVPDLRTLAVPQPSFVVSPLEDSACLLLRAPGHNWLFNSGRATAARYLTSRMGQYYGVNRLDGLVLTEISTAENGGAGMMITDFQPERLIAPPLRTRSPLEKELPQLAAQAGQPWEFWSAGQVRSLAPGVEVSVLSPAPDTEARSAADRALVLLFHAGGQNLLWAGNISPDQRDEILSAYPDLHADVLVEKGQSPLTETDRVWLQALQARLWLQIPVSIYAPRPLCDDPPLGPVPDCEIVPLGEKGAVEIHFQPGSILVRPCAGAK